MMSILYHAIREARRVRFQRCAALLLFLLLLFGWSSAGRAQSQPTSPSSAQATDAGPQKSNQPSSEITTRDEPTTFKVNVNLVLVRVVVRDAKGQAVANLKKEDFLLYDNRKPQVITQFSAEQGRGGAPAVPENGEAKNTAASAVAAPDSYIAYLFDDVHLTFGDLVQARMAADRHLASLRSTDRAALYTTSGRNVVDFTDDRAKLHAALLELQPRPITALGISSCFNLSYYMADLMENKHDPQAVQVATNDALTCEFGGNTRFLASARIQAESTARQILQEGEMEGHVALTVINDLIRRLSILPGRRSLVLISPGFLTPQMESEYMLAIDHAVRSQVTIGTLDARGLYVIPPGGDIANDAAPSAYSGAMKQQYATLEASANDDILAVLADGTGGLFFHNSNDLDEGFRRVASTPEYSYVLGFSPANLKLDGSYHSLKVTLAGPEKYSIQARRGYFAPKHTLDPAQQAKQEIEDAVFSREEMHGLPVELHTQFFKASDINAKLSVLAHIDVRRLHLRKADGRNTNELSVISALFDTNGNLLQGVQKTVTMRLKDETLETKMGSGITLRTSFDVKPGTYLVRLVVRDAEAQQLSAANDAVRIP